MTTLGYNPLTGDLVMHPAGSAQAGNLMLPDSNGDWCCGKCCLPPDCFCAYGFYEFITGASQNNAASAEGFYCQQGQFCRVENPAPGVCRWELEGTQYTGTNFPTYDGVALEINKDTCAWNLTGGISQNGFPQFLNPPCPDSCGPVIHGTTVNAAGDPNFPRPNAPSYDYINHGFIATPFGDCCKMCDLIAPFPARFPVYTINWNSMGYSNLVGPLCGVGSAVGGFGSDTPQPNDLGVTVTWSGNFFAISLNESLDPPGGTAVWSGEGDLCAGGAFTATLNNWNQAGPQPPNEVTVTFTPLECCV